MKIRKNFVPIIVLLFLPFVNYAFECDEGNPTEAIRDAIRDFVLLSPNPLCSRAEIDQMIINFFNEQDICGVCEPVMGGGRGEGSNTDDPWPGPEPNPGPEVCSANTPEGFYAGSDDLGLPWEICNCDMLQKMQDNLATVYVLIDDIDCSDTVNWNSGEGFDPIGDLANRFTGNFDGQNYKITNLYINRGDEDYVGLFGHTGSPAEIKNLRIIDFDITGKSHVGNLVGFADETTIIKAYAKGSVSGRIDVGGLLGYTYTVTITDSYATGSVSGDANIGGLVGRNGLNAIIINSYATGIVYGDEAGGLVGYNEWTITDSYATGSINGDYKAGGLVGHSQGEIINSYATGSVSGENSIGGLVGYSGGAITNSYAVGDVNGSFDVGGLVGIGIATVTNSYFVDDDINEFGTHEPDGEVAFYNSSHDVYYDPGLATWLWDTDVWQWSGIDYPTHK